MGRYEKLGEHLCSKGILAFGHDHGEESLLFCDATGDTGVLLLLATYVDVKHKAW